MSEKLNPSCFGDDDCDQCSNFAPCKIAANNFRRIENHGTAGEIREAGRIYSRISSIPPAEISSALADIIQHALTELEYRSSQPRSFAFGCRKSPRRQSLEQIEKYWR
jgi:hypothetical protein